ncbi:MAG: phosphoribosyltransferase domain-containing protein [Candidatus Parvarchaeota archaeon]|jgi:Predicted phosphoribosyltransferases|nr:phosphoribosyltransferase domain-containing protein [Candidatus Parvarchaeota archaeon]MCL5101550.1 phosphoribosyltransferase domain-containing protein [Candidatus Parvarchaeota archaeon]
MEKLEKFLLNWGEFGELSKAFSKQLKERYSGKIDVVIGIAKGGLPLSLQIANELGATWDSMRVASYIADYTRGKMNLLHDIHVDINNKTVMIVDDIADEGKTMEFVKNHLYTNYQPHEIITTVLFLKPTSKFKPDNYLEKTEKWVMFPWEAETEI